MYFKIRKSSNGQYYFTINADNHQILCTSETYLLKKEMDSAINIIKTEANLASIKDDSISRSMW